MMRLFPPCSALFVLLLTPAWGADTPPVTTFIGAGVWSRPAYNGDDTNRISPIPALRYYGQPWFARTTFGMLEGGVRYEALGGLTLGLQLAYEGGRDSAESAFLTAHQLPSLNPGLSWGGHIELEKNIGPMPIIALLRYRQDIEISRGAQADLRLIAGIYGKHGLNVGLFTQTTWSDRNSANYYYGISSQQASSSGLAAFNATEGILFSAYGLLWSYDISKHWIVMGSFENRQVREAVSNSPLVQQTINGYASSSLAYQY